MIFRSLRTKITVFMAAVLVLAIGFGTWVNIDFQTRELSKLTEEKVTILANTIERSLTSAMLEGRSKDVQRIVEMVGTHNKIGVIRILDTDGTILRSAKPAEIGRQTGIDMAGLDLDNQSNVIFEERDERGAPVLRNLRPILNRPECYHCHIPGQKFNGVLEVDVSLAEMQGHVDSLRKTMIIWAVAIALTLAVALSALLSRLVTSPIRELMNTMSKAEEGLDVRAKVASEDEIGRLAHSFNSMIIKLNKARKKVDKLHYEQMRKADRLATVGEMAAGIAHEIKNPLTGIAGVVQILGRDLAEEDPRRKIIKEVLEQIDRLDKAVKNLLSFARPPMPTLTHVNVNEVLDKLAAFLNPQFAKNRVLVSKEYTGDLPVIPGDPELLQQVFLNVILNGVQAMPEGGELRIRTSTLLVPEYVLHRIGRAENGDDLPEKGGPRAEAVAVNITDTGKGISPENIDKVFNPFFTTRQQGTGLGLSITHKIIEQHGGGITVESAPGAGTSFTIYLPVSREGVEAQAVRA